MFSVDAKLVACLAAAWLIELLLGAPRFLPRPRRAAAFMLRAAEGGFWALARGFTKRDRQADRRAADERRAGIFFTLYGLLFAFIAVAAPLELARRAHPVFYYLLSAAGFYFALDTRAAADGAWKRDAGAAGARTEREICRAVAALAKNALDGVAAPLFFIFLGMPLGLALPFAAARGTAELLDEHVGRRDSKYDFFGWGAARLDDVLNFVPARLCGLLLPLCALFCMGAGAAARSRSVARRDRLNHLSPNSAWPEAAFAGALGIRIESGISDRTHEREGGFSAASNAAVGDDLHAPETKDILLAVRLMIVFSAAMALLTCAALLWLS
jgi:adenosylcobinamide-phosphate synthase